MASSLLLSWSDAALRLIYVHEKEKQKPIFLYDQNAWKSKMVSSGESVSLTYLHEFWLYIVL